MCKYITVENAEQFLGKIVDCKRRVLHYYPIRIGKTIDGKYTYTSIKEKVTMSLTPDIRIPYDEILNRKEL